MAEFSGNVWGPDHNLPIRSTPDWMGRREIAAGKRVWIQFVSHGDYENAICIYDNPASNVFRIIRSNVGGNLGTLMLEASPTAFVLYITGWHKASTYNPHLPWEQSRCRTANVDATAAEFFFEDGSDNDFNDIACRIDYLPLT